MKRNVPLNRATPLKRGGRIRAKPRENWQAARPVVFERQAGRCIRCRRATTLSSGQVMHRHPVKMGRDRDDPDAECAHCGLNYNHPDHLWLTCGSACHEAEDRDRLDAATRSLAEDWPDEMLREFRLCRKDLYRKKA